MNYRHLPLACTLAGLSACAASPHQTTRMAVAPSAAIAAPPATTVSAGVAAAIPATYDPRMQDSDRKAKEMGYRIVMRDGVQFYCRTVAPMGSRIPQKECLRADAMEQQIRRTEEDKVNIRQFQYCGPSCVPPANAQ